LRGYIRGTEAGNRILDEIDMIEGHLHKIDVTVKTLLIAQIFWLLTLVIIVRRAVFWGHICTQPRFVAAAAVRDIILVLQPGRHFGLSWIQSETLKQIIRVIIAHSFLKSDGGRVIWLFNYSIRYQRVFLRDIISSYEDIWFLGWA